MDKGGRAVHSPPTIRRPSTDHRRRSRNPAVDGDDMGLSDIARRLFLGSLQPSTESFQRQILNYLHGNGETDAATLYDRIGIDPDEKGQRYAIDQAAQILVNRAEASAHRDGRRVDPANADGKYRLRLRLE